MAEYLFQDTTIQGIVDKVRAKAGKTGDIKGSEIESNVDEILTPTDGSIATKTSSDLSASGATVTVPAGYYDSQATKSVSTATQATPSISVDSAGLITASATQTAGYVSAGTKSATKQLTTKAATTITPSTSEQTAVASGIYTTGAIKVAAMSTATQATPSISVSSAGLITASATQTAGYVSAGTKSNTKQLTTQAAKTITPSTSSQTAVASGRYTTGAVTVAGDANLVAENIVSGKSIFGVAGSASSGSSGVFYGVTTGTANSTTISITGDATILADAYNNGSFYLTITSNAGVKHWIDYGLVCFYGPQWGTNYAVTMYTVDPDVGAVNYDSATQAKISVSLSGGTLTIDVSKSPNVYFMACNYAITLAKV